MAKSAAPFLSINPSGSIAGLLTASRWKGRPYLRLLVTPSNPQTSGQAAVRSILGAIAKASRAVLTSFKDMVGVGSPFFVAARDGAPSGQSWVSYLQQYDYNAATAIDAGWTALGGTKQGYFGNAAADAGLIDYAPTFPDGTTCAKGKQLYMLAYFASHALGGSIGTIADTAIAGANQGAVDDFGDAVHLTV